MVFLGRAAQLQDSRGADRHGEQPATHCGQQNGHAQRQTPVKAEELERCRRRVLSYEDQQQDQDEETRDQCRP